MSRARSEWEQRLREHGIVAKSAVTKAARLVVVADPDPLSGKARKARDYGVPIVDPDSTPAAITTQHPLPPPPVPPT